MARYRGAVDGGPARRHAVPGIVSEGLMFAAKPFSVGRLPRVVFGAGVFHEIPRIAHSYGRYALIVTGNRSLRASKNWSALLDGLRAAGMSVADMAVDREPSPQLVDSAVAAYHSKNMATS